MVPEAAPIPLPADVLAFLARPRHLFIATRVALVAEEGDDYACISGSLEEIPDRDLAQRHIAAMAHRYYDPTRAAQDIAVFRTHERISFRVVARRAEMRKS